LIGCVLSHKAQLVLERPAGDMFRHDGESFIFMQRPS